MEKFKIEYSKMVLDRWGHILSCKVNKEWCDTAFDAHNRAQELSNKFPKYDVNVFSPADEDGDCYCIWGFKGGKVIFNNPIYY